MRSTVSGAAVGLDEADDDVDALLVHHAVGVLSMSIGLAHAGRRADIDAQLGRVPWCVALER